MRGRRAMRALAGMFLVLATPALAPPAAGTVSLAELSEPGDILTALRLVGSTPSGRKLLEAARANVLRNEGHVAPDLASPDAESFLLGIIRPGPVSKTDAILTRYYDPRNGAEVRERRLSIVLKRGQRLDELVLDLAHELGHASGGPAWDPYDPKLTAAGYIRANIEGEGGEADALMAECQVASELAGQFTIASPRCFPEATRDRARVIREFYRVGEAVAALKERLGGRDEGLLGQLSSREPALISSTGNAAYPLALLEEFRALNDQACANSRRRLEGDRKPGTSSAARFVAGRCESRQNVTTR